MRGRAYDFVVEVLEFALGEAPFGVLLPSSLVLVVLVEEVHPGQSQYHEWLHQGA